MKKSNLKWAFKTLILSISLSIIFSLASQSLFPSLPIFFSIFIIIFFILLSVVFDIIAVAFTSISHSTIKRHFGEKGYKTAIKLYNNTEKVASFCGDVIGDICGILSGAGGVSLVVNMNLSNPNEYFIITCLISSLIAGLTIFGKAITKSYAVVNCEKVVMKIAKILEFSPLSWIYKVIKKNNKKNN